MPTARCDRPCGARWPRTQGCSLTGDGQVQDREQHRPGGDVTQPPPADMKMQRSSRDASAVPGLLAAWLADLLPADDLPQVTLLSGADKNGMSSETLLFDVAWRDAGEPRTAAYVARVQPSAADTPVFES